MDGLAGIGRVASRAGEASQYSALAAKSWSFLDGIDLTLDTISHCRHLWSRKTKTPSFVAASHAVFADSSNILCQYPRHPHPMREA